jgi:hypothetical protein
MVQNLRIYRDGESAPPSRRDYAELLDLCFAPNGEGHYLDDFPVWDPDLKAPGVSRVYAMDDNQRLIGTTGIRLVDWKRGPGQPVLKVGVIGAVAIHPMERGQKIASRLMELLIGHSDRSGNKILVLWSLDPRLYQNHGFKFLGQQVRVPSEVLIPLLEHAPDPALPPSAQFGQGYSDGIFALQKDRPDGFELRAGDFPWMKGHKNTQWKWISDGGAVKAFIGYNRGLDLPQILHEWGGNPAWVRTLVRRALAENAVVEMLGTDASLKPIFPDLPTVKDHCLSEPLILARDPDGILNRVENRELNLFGLDAS